MVELELFQRVERTVSLLDERQALPATLVQRAELVVSGGDGRLAEERPRHIDGAGRGKEPTEQQRPASKRSCLRRDGALIALGEAAALSRIRPEGDHGSGEEDEPRHPDEID